MRAKGCHIFASLNIATRTGMPNHYGRRYAKTLCYAVDSFILLSVSQLFIMSLARVIILLVSDHIDT